MSLGPIEIEPEILLLNLPSQAIGSIALSKRCEKGSRKQRRAHSRASAMPMGARLKPWPGGRLQICAPFGLGGGDFRGDGCPSSGNEVPNGSDQDEDEGHCVAFGDGELAPVG